MVDYLRCCVCGGKHKVSEKKFPMTIRKKSDNTVVGRVCVKCTKKEAKHRLALKSKESIR